MKAMLGEEGTEQFNIITKRDGQIVGNQAIHDPFIHTVVTIAISRWDLFKAMFSKQFITKVEVTVRGSEGAQRAIMTLNPHSLEIDTKAILEARARSREQNSGNNHCYAVES